MNHSTFVAVTRDALVTARRRKANIKQRGREVPRDLVLAIARLERAYNVVKGDRRRCFRAEAESAIEQAIHAVASSRARRGESSHARG